MSFDRQLDQTCPHVVHEELLFTQDDLRTIRPLRPIASSLSVKVLLNGGQLPVPSEGVYLPAILHGKAQGPFSYPTSTLAYQLGNQGVRLVTLPAASNQPPQRLCDLLNAKLVGVKAETLNQRVRLRTDLQGEGAILVLVAPSALTEVLGLPVAKMVRGQRNTPGWTLVRDPNTLDDRPTRLIVFDDPLDAYVNHVEVSYSTVQQECRRCGGMGYEYDYRLTRAGNYAEVRDTALLVQELLKDFLTLRGSNPFHAWYGADLIDRIGSKVVDGALLQNMIKSDISDAFNKWQVVKRGQEQVQVVSDDEYPFRLLQVLTQQDPQDPTVIFLSITVQNRTQGQPIVLERGFRIPDTSGLLLSAGGGPFRQSFTAPSLVG